MEDTLIGEEIRRIGAAPGEQIRAAAGRQEKQTSLSGGSGTAADWQKQKEEQARQRKLQNELRKCEDEIAKLEAESARLDEELAKPENCLDHHKLQELADSKSANEEALAELYDKWEMLQS